MKKETIFRHELNESIQANAAMNCLKNRNKHKQINEVAPVVAAASRMLLPMLRPVITKLVQKALVKIGTHARPTEVLKLVMGMLTKGELAKKMSEKCGLTWDEIPSNVKKEIQNAIFDAFKAQSPQEYDYDKDAVAMQLVKKSKKTLTTSWAEAPEMFILQKVRRMLADEWVALRWNTGLLDWVKAICNACDVVLGKANDREIKTLITYELRHHYLQQDDRKLGKAASYVIEKTGDKPASFNSQEINDWISEHDNDFRRVLFGSTQEQEENSLDTEYFSDLEEQEAYYENFRAIAELVATQIDRENGDDIGNNMNTLFEIVREVWNNNPDDLYIWDFDDVQENDCYKFFDKYYETIKNEYLKREHNNIMAATHDDLFA